MNSLKWKEERERDEESMREIYILGSEWVRERGRLLKRERERKTRRVCEWGKKGKVSEKQMCQNCMPTMNVNPL